MGGLPVEEWERQGAHNHRGRLVVVVLVVVVVVVVVLEGWW